MKTLTKFKTFASVALLAMGIAAPAHAVTVVFSDDFNSNGSDQLNGSLNGWTVSSGVIDVIGGTGTGYNWYPGNGSYLDMDGSAGAAGQNTTIVTNSSFTLNPGKYLFSFDFGLNQNDSAGDTDTLEAGFFDGSSYIPFLLADAGALGTGGSVFALASGLWNLSGGPVTGQFYIRGTSVGGLDQSGGIVDNFKVSAVPLPGAALLLLSGLVGLGGISRFRRRSA